MINQYLWIVLLKVSFQIHSVCLSSADVCITTLLFR
jgi:hypothetical protein